MQHYDVIVIGTGAANIVTDAALAQGLHVAIVERGSFGGTCLNRGCIPTKVMVTAANRIREIRESRRIGVTAENIRLDWDVLSKRLWKKIGESDGIKSYYEKFPNCGIYCGTAAFAAPHTISVTLNSGGNVMLTADKIIVATGAHTNIPSLPGLEEVGYVTSESFFGSAYPEKAYGSLILLGGGPIGCEFAHIFNAAGTDVTLIQHNIRLLPREEPSISAHILHSFRRYGIDVKLNQEPVSVTRRGRLKVITCRDRTTGKLREISAEEIFVASGIKPATDLLCLAKGSVRMDKRGYIETNEFLETTSEGVWALGDVNGRAPFRHKANYEAEILAHNLFSHHTPETWRWADYDAVPAVTYTYPETAHVGLTEADAIQRGFDVKTAMHRYSSTAKGYALGYEPGDEDDGFLHLVVDRKTRTILGAHIVGPEASILIQPFINAMMGGTHTLQPVHEDIASPTVRSLRNKHRFRTLPPNSIDAFNECMTPHPSLSELVMWTRYYYDHK